MSAEQPDGSPIEQSAYRGAISGSRLAVYEVFPTSNARRAHFARIIAHFYSTHGKSHFETGNPRRHLRYGPNSFRLNASGITIEAEEKRERWPKEPWQTIEAARCLRLPKNCNESRPVDWTARRDLLRCVQTRLPQGRRVGVVAQLVRAPDCRSGGCGFEPRPPRLVYDK